MIIRRTTAKDHEAIHATMSGAYDAYRDNGNDDEAADVFSQLQRWHHRLFPWCPLYWPPSMEPEIPEGKVETVPGSRFAAWADRHFLREGKS